MGIEIIGKLTQKNNGDFKLVDLENVDYDGTGKSAKQELEKKIEEAKNSSTPYDDTAIKTDINTIKTDLGTAQLTTTAKDVKGAVNEVAAQYKDIANKTITTEERTKLSSLKNYDDSGIKNDIQTQKSRIDTFTTLQDGSTTGDAELIDGRVGANGNHYNNIGGAIRGQFKSIMNKLKLIESDNIYNPNDLKKGYYNREGVLNSSEAYYNLSIDVKKDDVIRLYSWSSEQKKYNPYSFRFICAYNANGVDIENGKENVDTYTVSQDIIKIIVSINPNSLLYPYVTKNTTEAPLSYSAYFDPYYISTENFINDSADKRIKKISSELISENKNNGYWRKTGALSAGEEVLFPNNNIKKNTVMTISGVIETFEKITLGRKDDSTIYGYIDITNNDIKVYDASGLKYTYNHNITISNNIQIKLESQPSNDGYYEKYGNRIRIVSNGIEYTTPYFQFDSQSKGCPFIKLVTGKFSNYSASWTSLDANANIFAFGDSYFSFFTPRWTRFLIQDGYSDNVLLNGFPGQGSDSVNKAFDNVMSLGHPRYIFWCQGMNDPDKNEVNFTWKNMLDRMILYCNENNITPILSTIPNTPTNDNSYKNEIIRNSGYRYVDFAKAVGAEQKGSLWYTGMLDSDKVHPSETGARALYMQVIADFPEIMVTK